MSEPKYSDVFITKLELMWGEGFLSPGGAAEVAKVVEGLDLQGKQVVDIGVGAGGPAMALVETHGAAHVLGLDIEAPVLARAKDLIERRGLSDRIALKQVEPGPLPLADASVDVVFSKDAIIHIPDKRAFLADCFRVLKPGGWIAMSDWCRGEADFSPEMEQWLEITALGFELAPVGAMDALMREIGFEAVATLDRNAWLAGDAERSYQEMRGPLRPKLVDVLGEEGTEAWLERSRLRALVARQGHLRPAHFRGRKPA